MMNTYDGHGEEKWKLGIFGSAYDDTHGGDEDGHGEGEADAAEHLHAVRLCDENEGDDNDERESRHVQQEEAGKGPQLHRRQIDGSDSEEDMRDEMLVTQPLRLVARR